MAWGGRGIALEDVLAHVRLDGGAGLCSSAGTLKQARAQFEKEYIATVLEQHRGRISGRGAQPGKSSARISIARCESLKVNRTPKG